MQYVYVRPHVPVLCQTGALSVSVEHSGCYVRFGGVQITVARETGKPLYLHCRDAHEDFVAILRRHGYYHGIVHCFTGVHSGVTVNE